MLQNSILVGQYFRRESLFIISITDVLELFLGQLKEFGFLGYSDVNVHNILHEEGSLVYDRTLVKLL